MKVSLSLLYLLALIQKNFGEDIEVSDAFNKTHIKPSNAWTKREVDWFNAERRFIFGCDNEKD
jgi:hypothetical protein